MLFIGNNAVFSNYSIAAVNRIPAIVKMQIMTARTKIFTAFKLCIFTYLTVKRKHL